MDEDNKTVEDASVALAEDMHFVGRIDGFSVDTDAEESVGGRGNGPQPLRFLLLGVAGCTAMDVISILRKKRQEVDDLSVEVRGSRVEDHPRVYDSVEIVYALRGRGIDPRAVERAIELSETRYCPAIAMISGAVRLTSRYEIEEA